MSSTNVSLFSQMLGLVNRNIFNSCVKRHESDKHSKGINTWTHMAAMIFMQTSGAGSLRDISNGLLSATGNLSHMGIKTGMLKFLKTCILSCLNIWNLVCRSIGSMLGV